MVMIDIGSRIDGYAGDCVKETAGGHLFGIDVVKMLRRKKKSW